jgi:5-aminopentanamidase
MTLRLACLQGPVTDHPHGSPDPAADRQANLAYLDATAAAAAGRGARLLVTPEMFLTGYAIGAAAVRELAEPADGPSAAAISEIARHHETAILYGYPELGADGRVYNAVQLIDRDGTRLAGYRKTHLFGEVDRAAFTAGDQLVVQAQLEDVTVGLLICYDVEFPETVRAHGLAGTELLLVPTALMKPYEFVPRTLVPARAVESQLFVAYVNRIGVEREFEYCGESVVASPDAHVVAVGAPDHEELVFADVDLEELAASRSINTYLTDRRPELYTALASGPAGEPAEAPADLSANGANL